MERQRILAFAKPLVHNIWEEYEQDGLAIKLNHTTELWIDGFNWMNTNEIDLLDHSCILTDFNGHVLLTGLGLGLGILYAEKNPKVHEITVIENDLRVISAVLPMLPDIKKDLTVLVRDADEVDFSQYKFDCAFIDHAKKDPPIETIKKVEKICPHVRLWIEEWEKWR